jgi:Tol biopolymer transport system component
MELLFFDLISGENIHLPSKSASEVAWEPGGERVLLSELIEKDGGMNRHLILFDLQTEEKIDLSGNSQSDDAFPAWSPDGEWIAFVRKEKHDGIPSTEDQIWVMRADGSDAHPVTDTPDHIHGQPQWSPDGSWLVYQAFSAHQQVGPSVWALSVETGEANQIIASATNPVWLAPISNSQ